MQDYGFIDKYNELRTTIEKMTQADASIMGRDAWLVNAMQTSDMTLSDDGPNIGVHGMAFTSQTVGFEDFAFHIPKADIELFRIKQLLAPVTP